MKKFRNFLGSTNAVRRLSDAICMEHKLSVILNPKPSRGHYGKWLGEQKQPTYSDRLRQAIDAALKQKPKDFEHFLILIENAGYEVKRGTHTAFKGAGQQRFIRLRSLGEGYSESELREVIAGKKLHMLNKTAASKPNKQVNLIVDIQAKLQAGKGPGYERWVKTFNLKQMAHTLNYLTENNLLSYEALSKKAAETSARFHALSAQIKETEKRMAEIAVLKKQIINYSKTRDVYVAYRKSGYSKKFYEEHTADLLFHNEYFVSVRHPRPQEVRHPHRENPTPIPHRWCMAAARIAHGRHAVGSFRNCVQPSHGLAFNGQYMRVVNDTVADGIGHGRIIKQLMPAGDVELRTEDSGCHLTPGFN